jgi:hypothetical protein
VLTLVPKVLREFAPLLSRFCRKLERKDCRADVELDELLGLPPRSPMSFSNAELRVVSVLDDKLDDGSVLLISSLLVSSRISTLSVETMSCGPYGDAAELPAVLDALDVLGAGEFVVDEVAPADGLGVTAAVDGDTGDPDAADPGAVAAVELAAAEVPAAEVAAAEVAAAEVTVADVAAVEVAAVEAARVEPGRVGDAPASSPLASAW